MGLGRGEEVGRWRGRVNPVVVGGALKSPCIWAVLVATQGTSIAGWKDMLPPAQRWARMSSWWVALVLTPEWPGV